jgi:iron uptake system component EfeO
VPADPSPPAKEITMPSILGLGPSAARLLVVAGTGALAAVMAGCAAGGGASAGGDATRVAVESDAETCDLSTTSAPAGTIVFTVTNTGDDITEFYLYASDGEAVVGEVEDIGPGLTRDLTASLDAGTYVTACKPGMVGEGIRGSFTVAAS